MKTEKIEIPTSKVSAWAWPVQIGIGRNSNFLNFDPHRQHPSIARYSDVSSVESTSQKKTHYNILLFDSFDEAFANLEEKHNTTADVIIIHFLIEFSDEVTNWNTIDKLSKKWTRKTGAGGLYYIPASVSVEVLHENIMFQLSHNKGINEAIESMNNVIVRSYVAPNLNDRTKLSNYAHQVGLIASRDHSSRNRILFFGIDMTLGEAGKYLLQFAHALPYDHESETASILADMTTLIKTSMPDKSLVKKPKSASASGNKHKYLPGSMDDFDLPKDLGSLFRGISDKPHESSRGVKVGSEPASRDLSEFTKDDESSESVEALPWEEAKVERDLTDFVKPSPVVPRYVRAAVYNQEDKLLVNKYLLPQNAYFLQIGIGKDAAGWTIPNEDIAQLPEIFKDTQLQSIDIDLTIYIGKSKKAVYKRLSLPRDGESNLVTVNFSTNSTQKEFQADIYVYHESRLLQQLRYRIAVTVPGTIPVLEKPEFTALVKLRQNLSDLSGGSKFSASLNFSEKPAGLKKNEKIAVPGMHGRKPINLNYTTGLLELANNMKELLETAALYEDQTNLENTANVELLINLANQGYPLYINFLNEIKLDGPLQLISNFKEYLPLDFAYTLKPPTEHAKLCTKAKESLLQGKCCGCLENKIDDQYNTLCPFGFWGLKYIVERHQLPKESGTNESAFVIQFEPDTNRNTLHVFNKLLYASTNRVNAEVPASYSVMQKALIANSTTTPHEVKSWKAWLKDIAKTNPDTMLLIVHVEEDYSRKIRKLEIADQDFLEQPQFDERYLNTGLNKPMPLVILIGCETTQTSAYLFDAVNYIQNKGAAIVLSNFTKIKGEMATVIVSKLVQILRENAGNEIRFGEIILKLRQQLLASGMMLGLTLLAHGDADWKIKI